MRHTKISSVLIIAAVLMMLGSGACGRKGPDAPPDAVPDVFSFTALTSVPTNTVVVSSSITVSGINIAAQIYVSGTTDMKAEYSIDGGAYTSAVGKVANGQSVTVRQVSSSLPGRTTDAMLVIGGVAGYFSVTTIAPTTTTSIDAPAVTYYGIDGSVLVTVSSVAGGTPGGIVLLSVNNTPFKTQALLNSSTTFSIPKPNAGNYALTAAYFGDSIFSSSSATGTLSVGQALTTTMVSAPAVTYGANGSAIVTVSSNAGTPTGTVSLSVDSGTAMTKTLTNGSATFTISNPSAGSHTLSAAYNSQGNFSGSSAYGTLGVGQGATTITLDAPAITYGANGNVTVSVSSLSGTPSGSVSLSVDGQATSQVLNNGTATFLINKPGAGTHSLIATYAAQGNFLDSTSSSSLNVGQASTSTVISAPTVTYSANGTVTVTVSSTAGTPSGSVTFIVDGKTFPAQALSSGSTTTTITSPSAGLHTVSATYTDAQGNFATSSASATLTVNPAATTTTLSTQAITYGTNGSVTVKVSSTAGTPAGSVSLTVDSTTLSQGLDNNGSATFTIPKPDAGSHSLSATYAAQGNFGASSASGTLAVNKAATILSISATDVTYNANGQVTITVSSTAGTPSGDVTLSVDGQAAVPQTLVGDTTTFILTGPNAGSHSLNAAYAAQGNFDASSASGTLTVNRAATTTSITAPAITYGMDGSVTVTVNSTAGTPTGDVSLTVDSGTPVTQTLSGGSATFTISTPGTGNHNLSATYTAQGNYDASSAAGTLGVGPGATTMTLNAPGITYGTDGSVTVTVSSGAGIPTGNVSLSVDGQPAVTQALVGGSITFTIAGPNAGSHSLNAAYAAQGNFDASSASGTLTVNRAATTTSITAPAITYGMDGSVTVTVGSTGGTPTGDVSLTVDSGTPVTQTLSGGSATFTISTPGTGNHNLSATYTAQGNYDASSAAGTLGVGPGATTMTLNAPGITYGTDGSVTVTVSSGAGIPTGNVSLSVDGQPAVTQALVGDTTTFILTGPNAGSHSLNAAYAAQGNFDASSASGTLTVSKAVATVTLMSLSHVYDGTAKNATATTDPGGLTVTFTYNGSAVAPTNAGSYTVIGTITDPNYEGSATDTLVIDKATATVILADLIQTYDGTQKFATATTDPSGLLVMLTYDGSDVAPTAAGSYMVVGTISDNNYQGSATDVLTINP